MDKVNKNSLVPMMEGWFKGLPKLPAGIIDFLVMIAPWLALVFGILGVLGTISALGLMGMTLPYANMYGGVDTGINYIAVIGGLISSVLTLLAFPGLKAMKFNGWMMLFWSQVVGVVASVLGVAVGALNVGGIIGILLVFTFCSKLSTGTSSVLACSS